MSAHTYWRGIAFLLSLMFVGLVSTEANAVPGSETLVIIGGSQEPAKSYTFTNWATGSTNGCNTPAAKVAVTVRWYLVEVQATRVFIDKVYVSVRPTRGAFWDHVSMQDANGDFVRSHTIFQNMAANTTYSRFFQYDRWVPISTTAQIVQYNIIIMNNSGNEAVSCYGERYAVDLLRRR